MALGEGMTARGMLVQEFSFKGAAGFPNASDRRAVFWCGSIRRNFRTKRVVLDRAPPSSSE